VWRWAAANWSQLVLVWIKSHLDWRRLSGVEMTWLLYEHYVALIPDAQLRQFYRSVNDVDGERRMDANSFQESDL
jgi:hypothetical protein